MDSLQPQLARPALWARALPVAGAVLCLLALGGLIGAYPIPGLIGTAALMILALLFSKPEMTLPLALFAIPFDLLGHLTEDGLITVAKVLVGLAFVIWTCRTLVVKDRYPLAALTHPVALVMVLFIGANILSLINIVQLKLAAIFLLRRMNVVALALLIPIVLRDRRSWDRALLWMTLATFPIGCFGLYELITGQPILALVSYRSQDQLLLLSGQQWRIHGTFDDAPFHAIYMASAASLALLWLLRTRNRWLQVALGGLFLLDFVNIIGTASRGGLMGLGVILLVYWIGYGGKRRWLLAAGAAVMGIVTLGIALLLPQVPVYRYLQLSPEGDPTAKIRMGLYEAGFGMFSDHPIVGIGTGQWLRQYHRYYGSGSYKSKNWMPHNTYLQVAAENGTVGLVIYLLMLGAILHYYLLALGRTDDRGERLAVLGTLGAFLGYAAFALTSNVAENETYWVYMSFAMVAYQVVGRQPKALTNAT